MIIKKTETKKRDRKIRMKESEYQSNLTDSFLVGSITGMCAALLVNRVASIFSNSGRKKTERDHSSIECLVRD